MEVLHENKDRDKCFLIQDLKRIALCIAQQYAGKIKIEINIDKNKNDVKISVIEYGL
jgi:hypothetical protein